jgi:hypothetical protein
MNMSKLFLIGVFGLMAAAGVFASEELDVYTFLFRDALSPAERLLVLREVADAKIADAGPLYAEALAKLLTEQPTLKTSAERETADATAKLLAEQLGESRYAAAAPDLWRVNENFANPLVRAEALVAIGRTRAPDYLPRVVRLLSELNLKPTDDRDAGEKVAYGAIMALEKYGAIEGYTPVFYASVGWYSGRIKDQAAATLALIIDDPSDPLSAIIGGSDAYDVKQTALAVGDLSKAPAAGKARMAALALSEGWRAATVDVKERVILSGLRKKALGMISRYGAADAAVPLIERCYKEGLDAEEKLGAVAALGYLKSDAATKALAGFLVGLNDRRRDNAITQEDERLVRAVIPALGATGNRLAQTALKAVDAIDWTNAVKVLAADALKKIP